MLEKRVMGAWLSLRWLCGVGLCCLAVTSCSSDDSGGAAGTSGTSGVAGSSANGAAGQAGSSGNAGTSGNAGNAGVSGASAGAGAEAGAGAGGAGPAIGDPHAGEYELGPVEWEGSYWNSCAPYVSDVVMLEGGLLAGVGLDFNGHGELCDACIKVTAATGKTVITRVVTTGETTAPNNIDLSQSAYDAVTSGEYPRSMSWQIVECPDSGAMRYQFQTGANEYWSSFWVRNPRWPIASVEVKSTNHADFAALTRGDDGTYTDAAGFGAGAFSLRITAMGGQVITDTFPGFSPGDLLTSSGQFP